jgi:hypothetical protein
MDEQKQEVYERIPWETLEDRGKDRQWLIMGIASAVVAGSLGFSFMSNRSVPLPPEPSGVVTAEATPSTTLTPVPQPQPAPSIVSEADLYAVDPDRLASEAAAHARWVVREYLASAGSADQREILRSLLPADLPLPSIPEGVLVFVEWVDSVGVEELDVGTYRVDVLARYMVSTDGSDYQRVAPEIFTVDIGVADGLPRLLSAPSVKVAEATATAGLGLGDIPETVAASAASISPGSEIVGGYVSASGTWNVVVLTVGPGGVLRPETVTISP